jgi:lipoate-protein ligase B
MARSICEVFNLGVLDYQTAWDLQGRLATEIAAGIRLATLLLLEHPHTFTFGRRGQAANLLWDEDELARREVTIHWVDRGGDVTYHGPGQLVGYPLLPLLAPEQISTISSWDGGPVHTPRLVVDYVGYLRKLETVLLRALGELGVAAFQVEGLTGVWVGKATNRESMGKIAAIGVKVDARGVSRHGFALNVNPDMSFWDGIVGCGLDGYRVASLVELLDPLPAMERVRQAVIVAFGEVFECEMVGLEVNTLFDVPSGNPLFAFR